MVQPCCYESIQPRVRIGSREVSTYEIITIVELREVRDIKKRLASAWPEDRSVQVNGYDSMFKR